MDRASYLELLLNAGVLRFGEFKTKSGRLSPYFFNTGALDSGQTLGAAADAYAALIAERFPEVEGLFGPAYKGIPLAAMTAERLARRLGRDVSITFNRKEAKDHGEGGSLIGRALAGRKIVVIEDVITGGTSLREVKPLLADAQVIGIAVGVDRQERGTGDESAAREIEALYGVPVAAILSLDEIVERLHGREVAGRVWIDDAMRDRIDAYLAAHGAKR